MKILLTNDDGIYAEGMKKLHESLCHEEHSVRIVAPKVEHSGKSTSITLKQDIAVEHLPDLYTNTPSWAVFGTPADCVKLSLSNILDKKPDWILSGINCGSNAGANIFYSGTIGALIEGALQGVPGIAFSCVGTEKDGFKIREDAYEVASHFVMPIFRFLRDKSFPRGTLFNVNFPALPLEEIRGVRFATQSQDFWTDDPQKTGSKDGIDYFRLGCFQARFPETPFDDMKLLTEGYVTCVPIQVKDLTNHKIFNALKEDFDKANLLPELIS